LNQIPSISDALKATVAKVDAAIIANTSLDWGNLNKRVYYMQGHPMELAGILQSFTKASLPKYPLVILVRDVEDQTATTGQNGINTQFNARIIICMRTEPSLRGDAREAATFKPVLHPIFWELLNQISNSDLFNMPTIEDMKLKWTDRYYWGVNDENKNIFNDHIDAVEIKSISLNVNNEHCIFKNF